MPQSLSSILIHLVFSTKNRKRFITPTIEVELHPYMATVLRQLWHISRPCLLPSTNRSQRFGGGDALAFGSLIDGLSHRRFA